MPSLDVRGLAYPTLLAGGSHRNHCELTLAAERELERHGLPKKATQDPRC